MRKAKTLLYPLGGILLMVAIALITTWTAATPEQHDEIVTWVSDQAVQEPETDVRQIDWSSMPDEVVAWVEVPGTEIDEPIVQASADYPNRYLYADAFGEGKYGTPYIDCDCSLDGPFMIVYGHHMDDGSVFADFASFSDEGYAKDHRTIYLYTRTDNERHELKVVAANVVNASYEQLQTEFKDDAAFDEYIGECFEESEVVLEKPEDVDRLYAFATCSYETWNSRTVVYAVDHV